MTTSDRLGEPLDLPTDEALDIGELTPDELEEAKVYDRHDNVVGEVKEVLASDENTVETLVVDVGGFLGVATRRVGIGGHQVTLRRGDDGAVRIYLKLTDEALRSLPERTGPVVPPGAPGYRT